MPCWTAAVGGTAEGRDWHWVDPSFLPTDTSRTYVVSLNKYISHCVTQWRTNCMFWIYIYNGVRTGDTNSTLLWSLQFLQPGPFIYRNYTLLLGSIAFFFFQGTITCLDVAIHRASSMGCFVLVKFLTNWWQTPSLSSSKSRTWQFHVQSALIEINVPSGETLNCTDYPQKDNKHNARHGTQIVQNIEAKLTNQGQIYTYILTIYLYSNHFFLLSYFHLSFQHKFLWFKRSYILYTHMPQGVQSNPTGERRPLLRNAVHSICPFCSVGTPTKISFCRGFFWKPMLNHDLTSGEIQLELLIAIIAIILRCVFQCRTFATNIKIWICIYVRAYYWATA